MKPYPYRPDLVQKARENRKNPTPAEKKIWYEILKSKYFEGYRFNRQKPVMNYILDFYCAELRLGIEIDGHLHGERTQYDEERTKRLREIGIEIVRYGNNEVMNNISGVYDDLLQKIQARKQQT